MIFDDLINKVFKKSNKDEEITTETNNEPQSDDGDTPEFLSEDNIPTFDSGTESMPMVDDIFLDLPEQSMESSVVKPENSNSDLPELFASGEAPDDPPDTPLPQPEPQEKPKEKVKKSRIDIQLDDLLRKDKAHKQKETTVDIKKDFVSDVQVFDNKEDIDETDVELVPEEKIFGILTFNAAIGATAGSVLFLVLLIVIVRVLNNGIQENLQRIERHSQTIAQPMQVANNANYIYLQKLEKLGDETLVIQKMLIDRMANVFYISKKINLDNYNVSLVDDKGNLYGIDLTFVKNENLPQYGSTETVLRFEPLKEGVEKFTLFIHEPQTNNSAIFNLDLEHKLTQSTPYRIAVSPVAKDSSLSVWAELDRAIFSSQGSIVNYRLSWSDDNNTISLGSKNDRSFDNIVMQEGAKSVTPTKARANEYTFGDKNSILGRMDFEPIRSLDSVVTISFKNLYEKINYPAEIPIGDLFFASEESPLEFNVGSKKVVFERLGKVGENYVLVLHAEDEMVYAVSNPEKSLDNRTEVILDAQLVAETISGMEVVLDGNNKASQIGTDILFNAKNASVFMEGIPRANYKLRISNIYFKLHEVNVDLDLSKEQMTQSRDNERFEKFITDAYRSIILYKYGKGPKENISGFSPTLLEDSSFMSSYESGSYSGNDGEGSVQIITLSKGIEYNLAVVQEMWKEPGGLNKITYRTHKIVITNNQWGWEIASDEIIK